MNFYFQDSNGPKEYANLGKNKSGYKGALLYLF